MRPRLPALLLALLAACSSNTASLPDAGADPTGSGGALQSETVLVDGITAVPPDPYALEHLAVRGDSLHATVRFGGGCRTHEFRLLILKTFRESEPVQGDAVISHRANGDPCRALLTRTLAFDLAPIREHYRQSYQREHGAIRLRLLPPASGTVEYRF